MSATRGVGPEAAGDEDRASLGLAASCGQGFEAGGLTAEVATAQAHIERADRSWNRGEDEQARAAERDAVLVALRLATRRSPSPSEHAARVVGLRSVAAAIDERRRADLSSLAEAALSAEVALRSAVGLPPYGGRIGGWMQGIDTAPERTNHGDASRARLDDLEAAVGEANALQALVDARGFLREIVAQRRAGEPAEAAWEGFERCALGLCVSPAGSLLARLERRRALLVMWRTLRRRRPLAAAVLRRRVLLDRALRPGPVR